MNKIDINPYKYLELKEGDERRDQLLESIKDKDTHLPKGLLYEDLDGGFINFVENDLKLVIDGSTIPVIFLSLQRWNEFTKTWEFTDDYSNIKIPFITITKVRNSNLSETPLLYNIPQGSKYFYYRVPTFDGQKNNVEVYKIPYPVPTDINYEVRFFTYKNTQLNEFNQIILKKFSSRQAYSKINGHYIPILHEDVSDESDISDFEKKRFYVQKYDFKMVAFLLDDKDFKKVPTITRSKLNFNVESQTESINLIGLEARKLIRQAKRRGGLTLPTIDCTIYTSNILACEGDNDININNISFSGLNQTIQNLLNFSGSTRDYIASYPLSSWTTIGDIQYIDVDHNMNKNGQLITSIYETNTNNQLFYDIDFINNNQLRLLTYSNPSGAKAFDIVVEYRQ